MSRVLSDWTKETVVETRKTKELEGIKCDKCGCVIETTPKNLLEDPNIYYYVSLHSRISTYINETETTYADICPHCLCDYIRTFFESHKSHMSIRVDKKAAIREDVHSDKNGNFKK